MPTFLWRNFVRCAFLVFSTTDFNVLLPKNFSKVSKKVHEDTRPQVIDEEKLKVFTLKISTWNHFSMLETSYQSLSKEEKTNLLKRYYAGLDAKYYGKEPGKFYSLSSEDCLIVFWLRITVLPAVIWLLFVCMFRYKCRHVCTFNSCS